MTNGCRNSLVVVEIKSHDAHVVQRELNGSARLLHRHPTSHRPVNFVCKPILAGNSFQLQDLFEVARKPGNIVPDWRGSGRRRFVSNDCLWRRTEKVVYLKSQGRFVLFTICKSELVVAGGSACNVHRGSFSFCGTLQCAQIL